MDDLGDRVLGPAAGPVGVARRVEADSKIGSRTSLRAICTTRSLSVGIPRRRIRPSRLGINRSRTGSGRNDPDLSSSRSLDEELLDATRFDVAASVGINAGGA